MAKYLSINLFLSKQAGISPRFYQVYTKNLVTGAVFHRKRKILIQVHGTLGRVFPNTTLG